jgi:hypothetical protein
MEPEMKFMILALLVSLLVFCIALVRWWIVVGRKPPKAGTYWPMPPVPPANLRRPNANYKRAIAAADARNKPVISKIETIGMFPESHIWAVVYPMLYDHLRNADEAKACEHHARRLNLKSRIEKRSQNESHRKIQQ